jgi:hypothetical protein
MRFGWLAFRWIEHGQTTHSFPNYGPYRLRVTRSLTAARTSMKHGQLPGPGSPHADSFGTLEEMMMSESEPGTSSSRVGTAGGSGGSSSPTSSDPLAARLLAVQRALTALSADSEVLARLNSRFMAICTALKMPGASRIRCIRRLNELMAEAEQVRAGNSTSRHKDV